MSAPTTRFVEGTAGGVIAYQVTGSGPPDVLQIPGWVSNVDLVWEMDMTRSYYERLRSFARLIHFDKPGTGVSDPIHKVPSVEDRIVDTLRVLEVAESKRAAVIGVSEGAMQAVVLAGTRPDLVSHLVLFAPMVGWGPRMSEVLGFDAQAMLDVTRQETLEGWGEGAMAEVFMPSLLDADGGRSVWARVQRACSTRGMAVAYLDVLRQIDVWDLLPAIRVPTLVISREGDMVTPPRVSEAVTAAIPGAQSRLLPGRDHVPFLGDSDAVADLIQEFVTGHRPQREPDRVLATVLFTDIVGSTERAAAEGDARWRDLLTAHERESRRAVDTHLGRWIKSTGDGLLATFDGPARAVRCAHSVIGSARALGLGVRAGVHTGEVELLGGDVGGLAVHIGARVSALADDGEVLASRTVRDLSAGSGISFEPRGEHELKGIPDRWELFSAAA